MNFSNGKYRNILNLQKSKKKTRIDVQWEKDYNNIFFDLSRDPNPNVI